MNWRIWFRSVPGMYEQYDGYIDAYGDDRDTAIEDAFRQLKRTFPDRSRSCWRVEKTELL